MFRYFKLCSDLDSIMHVFNNDKDNNNDNENNNNINNNNNNDNENNYDNNDNINDYNGCSLVFVFYFHAFYLVYHFNLAVCLTPQIDGTTEMYRFFYHLIPM